MKRVKLPQKIQVGGGVDMVAFQCPGCLQIHCHDWQGDGFYLPQCPQGMYYWKTQSGYYLEGRA